MSSIDRDSAADGGAVCRAAFGRDGLIVVPRLVDSELIEALRADMAAQWSRRAVAGGRVQDLWVRSAAVRRLAGHPGIAGALHELYGRRPIPFQTLSFRTGTEQPLHADTIHFDTVPGGWMCGVWVALEEVGPTQGPLRWVPGSHLVTGPRPEGFGAGAVFDNPGYEAAVEAQVEAQGWHAEQLLVRAGDAVIWSAEVLHGGATVTDPASTRWSQVTHYVFEGFPAVTPQKSRPAQGHWWLRDPVVNVATLRTERGVDPTTGASAPIRMRRGLARFPRPTDPAPSVVERCASAALGACRRARVAPRLLRARLVRSR
ncbi:MAG: phytanoyl-CoA dioxygenase family protein [Microthrixaceae bacterium]